MVTAIRTQETAAQALERLAAKARSEGVKLLQDATTGAYYATSASTPGTRYHVTSDGCECRGFQQYHRCKHYAALTMAFRGIDHAKQSPICEYCNGKGEIPSLYGGMWAMSIPMQACKHCRGTGEALREVA